MKRIMPLPISIYRIRKLYGQRSAQRSTTLVHGSVLWVDRGCMQSSQVAHVMRRIGVVVGGMPHLTGCLLHRYTR